MFELLITHLQFYLGIDFKSTSHISFVCLCTTLKCLTVLLNDHKNRLFRMYLTFSSLLTRTWH